MTETMRRRLKDWFTAKFQSTPPIPVVEELGAIVTDIREAKNAISDLTERLEGLTLNLKARKQGFRVKNNWLKRQHSSTGQCLKCLQFGSRKAF